MFLNIQIDLLILKTYDGQFTLTTKKSLHIIFKPGPHQQQCRSNWQLCGLLLRHCWWCGRGLTDHSLVSLGLCRVQLSQVSVKHAGTYTVTASNRVGSVSTTATLTVSQGARSAITSLP